MSSRFEHQDLVLVEANPEQAKITNRNSYMSWGYPVLTIGEYIKREEILANNEFTSENFKVWILISRKSSVNCNSTTLNDTEPEIFSQCETFKRKTLITLSPGQIKEEICYCITALFTPPKYRHKGYATTMMKILDNKLRYEYKATYSYLYSEIGPDFYSRLGWKIFAHKEIRFKVDGKFSATSRNSETIVAINQYNLESIVNKDCEIIKKELMKLNKKSVVILPTKPAFDWLFQKTKFYSKFHSDTDDPRLFGAMILKNGFVNENDNEEMLKGFIMWNHDFKENELLIVRFRSESPYMTRLLLQQAMHEAIKFQLTQIVLWNPDLKLFSISEDINIFNGIVVERTESLPSLAWYADDDDDVDWILNEKYIWV
ncbi:3020_t:CDS:2 [Scutellospora calospora]|uniref:3020_t:CDS:1 n=1 Tax=Scutellospora calospora TaxID=85575 RepID=A0ACA9MSK8_9GLOM|nr:3020_t:CDS:2 [Scutellospora calospora]